MSQDEIISARKPWTPSSNKPKDLKNTDRLLYSVAINSNQPTPDNIQSFAYKTQFGLPLESSKPHLRTLKKSKSISGVYI